MKHFDINLVAIAVCLALSAGAMAGNISEDNHSTAKDRIAAEYKLAKSRCDSLSGNRNDICVAEAKGAKDVALAELEASYKPSQETRYEARMAKGEANYAISMERCDELSGNAKDVCVKEAKSAKTAVESDAKADMKVSTATTAADETSVEARGKANVQAADAREEAKEDKVKAEYKVATEKCDAYAGASKDECLTRAKLLENVK